MNCETVKLVLSDFSVEEMSVGLRAEVEGHLHQCASCAEDVALDRKLVEVFSTMGREVEMPDMFAIKEAIDRRIAALGRHNQRTRYSLVEVVEQYHLTPEQTGRLCAELASVQLGSQYYFEKVAVELWCRRGGAATADNAESASKAG